MRINNNMLAMNTHRQMGITGGNQSKAMEKLSSGLKINRAGDDAAGLSISEKMRGQIRGLNMASKNAQDGISMIQTAEGALNETHAILQRMRELAVQSSSDTNVNDLDRESMQNEFTKLKEEVDRIGNTTEFNTQSLLKGDGGKNLEGINIQAASLGNLTGGAERVTVEATTGLTTITAAAVAADTVSVTINGQTLTATFKADGTAGEASHEGYNVVSGGNTTKADVNIDATQTTDETGAALRDTFQKMIDANDELKGNYVVSGSGANMTISAVKGGDFEGSKGVMSAVTKSGTIAGTLGGANTGTTTAAVQASKTLTMPTDTEVAAGLEGKGITINGTALEFYDATKGVYDGDAQGIDIGGITTKAGLTNAIVAQAKIDGVVLSNDTDNLKVTAEKGGTAGNNINTADGGIQSDFEAQFQIGANEGQNMTINIADMRADALGISGIDLGTREGAEAAMTTINDAINTVSAQRSALGAFQNRLEHTIKNLDNSAENLQAAESRIRDVDMAKEMMNLTKQNILQQASQAMMAQANSASQGVLQLLR